MPDSIDFDPTNKRLLIGTGFIDSVLPEVWNYEVSGKQVLRQWFSYRKANRERPVIGDKRPASALGSIQPDHWLPEYTTELLNVLHVLTLLVAIEPKQEELLDHICSRPTITLEDLKNSNAFDLPLHYPTSPLKASKEEIAPPLFEDLV